MILLSVVLGWWNEYSAERTIDHLLKKISPTALVLRQDVKTEIPASHLTIGDIVLLAPGSIVPADLRLIETKDCEINESALTGESHPVYKDCEPLLHKSSTAPRNLALMGTSIVSGVAKGVVFRIGKDTEFGKIAKSTTFLKPTTEFQKGISGFGNLIVKVILLLTLGLFGINTFLGRPFLESLLFALAIAVGLTPELLPVIITVSLSHGANKLFKKHVVVKQLISIENLGNMDILCTDKTGTLTEGTIQVVDFIDVKEEKDPHIMQLALACNNVTSSHKIGVNGIDMAVWEYARKNGYIPDKTLVKLEEEPFDYNRKMSYAIISRQRETYLIVKGAPDEILDHCSPLHYKHKLLDRFKSLNAQGYRIVAIASRKLPHRNAYDWDDVAELQYEGYITFLDIPKKSAKEALDTLHALNVQTKIITGDNEIVARKVCDDVGMKVEGVMTGSELESLSDHQFEQVVSSTNVFARVSPDQKLRIVQTLQKLGHTVGYMGDGINDIPSLHSADVGISVNTALDVAKDAASIVLLQKGLGVIADGVTEGRKTFSNTIKYILMGTSSNFGNMFSAAGASFLLPFLPMTPLQILLTNGLYDLSQLSLPSDNVDQEALIKPRHWNINFIRNYMIFFGPLSSLYDFATFGIMFYFFHARGTLFQTGWFIESVATEILVVFVIRTSRFPFFRSHPSKWLIITCLGMVSLGIAIPFSPFAQQLGFIAPPPAYFIILAILISTYLMLVEAVKNLFLKKYQP